MQIAHARVSSSSTSLNLCLNRICEGGERLPSNVPVSQPKGCGTGFSVLFSQPEGCLQSRGTDAVLEQRDEQREALRAQEDDMLWLKAQQTASSLRPTRAASAGGRGFLLHPELPLHA
jgi:hypothetical protein